MLASLPLTSIAAVFGFLAVAIGAFGAHALKARFGPEQMAWFQTGVQYHVAHALAALLAAQLAPRVGSGAQASAALFLAGIVIFSGSLYLLALTEQRWLGAITPLGGTLFLAGWLTLAIAARSLR